MVLDSWMIPSSPVANPASKPQNHVVGVCDPISMSTWPVYFSRTSEGKARNTITSHQTFSNKTWNTCTDGGIQSMWRDFPVKAAFTSWSITANNFLISCIQKPRQQSRTPRSSHGTELQSLHGCFGIQESVTELYLICIDMPRVMFTRRIVLCC